MANPTLDWLKNTTRFIRNPLGIIGLFIALIYGSAVIVSGASPHLTKNQRWVFVFFDVVFPNVVLWVFYLLVTKHHFKLYAPSDWKDERRVFGSQSFETKVAKKEEEARELVATESDVTEQIETSDPERTMPPITPAMSAAEAKRSFLKLIQEAEDLAFKRLSQKYREIINKDASVSVAGRLIAFDGVISTDDRVALIEVKLIRSLKNLRNLADHALGNALLVAADFEANNYYGRKIRRLEFIFVVVTDGLDEQKRRQVERIAMQILDGQSLLRPTVELFDLEELRNWEASSVIS